MAVTLIAAFVVVGVIMGLTPQVATRPDGPLHLLSRTGIDRRDGAASTGSAKAGTAIAVPGIAARGTGAARLATPAGDAVDTADDMGRTSVASAASTAGIRR